jgi:hypothetical protein
VLVNGNAHGNVIGGNLRSVIRENTFSGNLGYGLVFSGRSHRNLVFGTFIGTEILGTTALANAKGGVLVAGSAHGNSIGAPLRRPKNLISGNTGNGVTLTSGTSTTGSSATSSASTGSASRSPTPATPSWTTATKTTSAATTPPNPRPRAAPPASPRPRPAAEVSRERAVF